MTPMVRAAGVNTGLGGMTTRAVYKIGYRASHSRERAKSAAVKAATKACEDDGYNVVGVSEVSLIETDAHREAGDYLVRVVVERERVAAQ